MTLKELKTRHCDVILDEIQWDDLPQLANGAAVFYASLANGTRPKEDRRVLYAGQVLTSGMTGPDELIIMRTTSHGNPRLDAVTKQAAGSGRVALFRTRPIPSWDRRNLQSWTDWT